ncbi:hypothetical protein LSAT2_029123, partial [Lamellibrachia satsuma]
PRAGVLGRVASTSSSPSSSVSSVDVVSEEAGVAPDDAGGMLIFWISGSSRPPASTFSECGTAPRLLFCNY